ncbi:FlgB family protein [Henriciella aquimarina]|uniref:FlgB family protein n=1 Tax=Henriciella aquimarina TaxID=545261 RepID=UPI001F34B8D9|nr:FlgB family protein [Henriciella aquimarina]
MISNLDVFRIYSAMARHAAESQRMSATNIAHADEPGYKAGEVESFEAYLKRTSSAAAAGSHTDGFKTGEASTPASPNGNTVSLEHEIYKSAEAVGQHEMAMNVYSKSLDLLRAAIGKKY